MFAVLNLTRGITNTITIKSKSKSRGLAAHFATAASTLNPSFVTKSPVRRELLKDISRLVVKLGTGVLTDSQKQPDPAQLEQLVIALNRLVSILLANQCIESLNPCPAWGMCRV